MQKGPQDQKRPADVNTRAVMIAKIATGHEMLTARIYHEVHEVDAPLVPFGVTRQELIEVVRGVVGARADAVENDPVTADSKRPSAQGPKCRMQRGP